MLSFFYKKNNNHVAQTFALMYVNNNVKEIFGVFEIFCTFASPIDKN
jgi:hypothetical protein